ncbi:MAG TPA: hypothetical protein VHG08_19505 [Longimicrobium sp.]|nr:hypothetical protein [Longimicrobium sp.]
MMQRIIRRSAAALGGVLLAGGCESAAGPDIEQFNGCRELQSIRFPATVNGTLEADDCEASFQAKIDFNLLQVSRGEQPVTITVESTAFAPAVTLWQGFEEDADGIVLDHDEARDPGDMNAQIVSTLRGEAIYVIGVRTHDFELGAYRLTLR